MACCAITKITACSPGATSVDFFKFCSEDSRARLVGTDICLNPASIMQQENLVCINQAFMVGDRILGLQFHLEYTGRNVRAMIQNAGPEWAQDKFVQPASDLLSDTARIRKARALLFGLLDEWIALPFPK